jgi:hypothetical protein
MKPFILYSKVSHVTGKALCEALGWDGGMKMSKIEDYTHLIRWGTTLNSDLDTTMRLKHRPVYNKAKTINNMVNRQHMLALISGAVGSRCIGQHPHVQNQIVDPGNWVLRHRFGRWGKDIILPEKLDCTNINTAALDGYFMMRRWPADYEVRIHIMNDTSISFQVKGQKDKNGDPFFTLDPQPGFKIRNDRNGWHLYPLSNELARQLGIDKSSIRTTAKQVLGTTGLSFGCVDFMVRVPAGPWREFDFRCIEVNTAPGLANSTLEAYVEGFKSLVNTTPMVGDEDEFPSDPYGDQFDEEDEDEDDMEDWDGPTSVQERASAPQPLPPAPRAQSRVLSEQTVHEQLQAYSREMNARQLSFIPAPAPVRRPSAIWDWAAGGLGTSNGNDSDTGNNR